jgi:hypothetical protein
MKNQTTQSAESLPDTTTTWITQAQAARLRKCSRQAISKLVKSGRLTTSNNKVILSEVLSLIAQRGPRAGKDFLA